MTTPAADMAAGGCSYAGTIHHVHTRTTCFAHLRDHAVCLMKRRGRHRLRGGCDGQSKCNSDEPNHCHLPYEPSKKDFLEEERAPSRRLRFQYTPYCALLRVSDAAFLSQHKVRGLFYRGFYAGRWHSKYCVMPSDQPPLAERSPVVATVGLLVGKKGTGLLEAEAWSADRSRRAVRNVGKATWAYILFLEQVISFHVPPSLTQSCSLFAFFTSPAKAGPVKASARRLVPGHCLQAARAAQL